MDEDAQGDQGHPEDVVAAAVESDPEKPDADSDSDSEPEEIAPEDEIAVDRVDLDDSLGARRRLPAMEPLEMDSDVVEAEESVLLDPSHPRRRRSRRMAYTAFAIVVGAAIVFVVVLVGVLMSTGLLAIPEPVPPTDPHERAEWLMSYIPLVDGHNDLGEKIVQIKKLGLPSFKTFNLDLPLTDGQQQDLITAGVVPFQTDFERSHTGHLGGQFWSVYCDCQKYNESDAVRKALDLFSLYADMALIYKDKIEFIHEIDRLIPVFEEPKIASMIGVEGGQMIDMDIAVLRQFYRMGARYLTLTHNCNTRWADSCCDPSGLFPHGGLSAWGKGTIKEMNRLGIAVDLSHASVGTMRDALEATEAPVMFSHSNAFAVCPHPRNVPDDILLKLKENDGIIMITFVEMELQANYSKLYSGKQYYDKVAAWELAHPADRANIDWVMKHIEHIKTLHEGSVDHIGIGSDFDGSAFMVDGLQDVSMFPVLIAEFVKRGYTDHEIEKILGQNVIRVMKRIETVRGQETLDTIFVK